MSARQAKRLGKLASKTEVHNADADSEEDVDVLEEKRPVTAGFSFLADSDSEDDESEKEDGDDEAETAEDAPTVPVSVVKEETRIEPPASKSKKKKAKKRKGGKKNRGAADDGGDEQEEENVDDLLEALASEAGGLSVDSTASSRDSKENALLAVQLNFINADKEMKRIFGVREVRESTSSRRLDPRNVARKTTKKVFMITPHDDWPRPPTFVGGGIRWTRANKPSGPAWNSFCQYFEITWSMAYKKAQEEFEVLQRTHDPNLIGHFLQRYPFHIDALLQMSEVFQHHGQMDHASDCIKRCIYVLELAWADQFDVSKGDCRMDMATEHNDGFFKALFLLMKQVGRRGCMRSAFETAKLLLSLDPHGDPMNVLLAIDYYAITARQCEFVVDLVKSSMEAVDRCATTSDKSTTKSRNGSSKPNHDNISALPNLQFSLALAHQFLGNEDDARETLARALLRFPSTLKPLLDKIGVNSSSGSWQTVLGSRVFANAKTIDENGALQHILDIYVTRNHTVWKVNEVQSFLLKSAQYATSSPALAAETPQVLELPPSLIKYKRSYPGDYSDEITTLPPDHPMLQPPQLPNIGDLGPEELAQLAQLQHLPPEQLAQLAGQLQHEAEAGNLPADANPLLLFLQTLLPWNRVQGAGEAGAGGGAGGGDVADGGQ